MILAGDVGGTKTILALFRADGGRLRTVREETYPSGEAGSIAEMMDAFLAGGGERPRVGVLGIAGPIHGGRSTRVNLPWTVDAARLERRFDFDRIGLVNDLEATARGIPHLARSKLRDLTPGLRARRGLAGVVAAGTGFGTAILIRGEERIRAFAAEGGHQTWGPPDRKAESLWRSLARAHGRVEVEHVVSGPGLAAIYDDLLAGSGGRPTRRAERRLRRADDRSAEIARMADEGADRVATRALDRFLRYYGAATGDVALTLGAVGGMYVAGGIASKLVDRMADGPFLDAFRAKGKLSDHVARIPVKVVLEPRCALIGAAAFAAFESDGRR